MDKLQQHQNTENSKKIPSTTKKPQNAARLCENDRFKATSKYTPTSVNEVNVIRSHPKRPLSRFILFRSDLSKLSRKLSSAEAAAQWKTINEQQRQHYQQRHEDERDQYKYELHRRV